MKPWDNDQVIDFGQKSKAKHSSPEDIKSLVAQLESAADNARNAVKEYKTIAEAEEAKEKAESALEDSHHALAEITAKLEKGNEIARENAAHVASLETRIAHLEKEVKRAESQSLKSSQESTKLRDRLEKEHDQRLQAEAHLKVLAGEPRQMPDLSRMESLLNNMAHRGPPAPLRRGTWSFDVARDADGHISRVVARPI